ncbi:YgiW/YdeI family stress tolerance OB fold protein [Utexia brackfieldae]|uniref:YgiW/YdeI family stress tolerance OB fold protein n=1 Tax=Utexia brackfieldae TaxID=3074108 RepID=UPI00370DAEA9
MKKLTLVCLITTLCLSGATMAKSHPQGGFNDGTMHPELSAGGFQGGLVSANTVEQAKQLPDDAWVVLKGHIVKQTGKEEYTFRDSTGDIQVEIDRHRWRGQTINPDDVVEIAGEIDKDWNSIEIEVKEIKLVTATPAK